jgi:hypothetical protein
LSSQPRHPATGTFISQHPERDPTNPPGVHTPYTPVGIDQAVKEDHDGIKGLFEQFFDESKDLKTRQRLAWQIIRDLTIHSLAEEEVSSIRVCFRQHAAFRVKVQMHGQLAGEGAHYDNVSNSGCHCYDLAAFHEKVQVQNDIVIWELHLYRGIKGCRKHCCYSMFMH